MALLTGNIIIGILLVVITLLISFYYYIKSKQNYWKHRGIPFVKPTFFFGVMKNTVFNIKSFLETQHEIYKELDGERFGGYYEFISPNLFIRDPDLMEKVLIKDFNHFVDRDDNTGSSKELMMLSLLNLNGNNWKYLRNRLTPTFTSGKLKGMFDQICNCGEELATQLRSYSESGTAINAKEILSLFTTDVIASCAFGLQFKHDSEEAKLFRQNTQSIFQPSKLQTFRLMFFMTCRPLAQFLGITLLPKRINDYFLNLVNSTVSERKRCGTKRQDFLGLLIDLQEREKSGNVEQAHQDWREEDEHLKQESFRGVGVDGQGFEFSDEVLAAQAFLFLIAGVESTSGSLAFILYSLAVNPEIQKKAQKEIDAVLAESGCTYQAVKNMTYLDQVVQEALRMFSFTIALNRVVTSPYKIPGTDIILQKGQRVTVPVSAVHMDPRYHTDPDKFDPDRFKDNNHRTSLSYMPFGNGPRMCIAMRFAVLEMKVCLARVLSQFSISLCERTTSPLQYDPSSFLPTPKGGIWLHLKTRNQ